MFVCDISEYFVLWRFSVNGIEESSKSYLPPSLLKYAYNTYILQSEG